ncbi:MAG: hypothetical protein J1F12_01915 [Muribaculaceae bacterium]|nr:hypothetical protein [Muribaculaceae bacterium]
MNQIARHISYLLLTCKNVTVPGLGTFYTNYQRAAFDPEEGIFYPAGIRIKFKDVTSGNLNLLSESLVRKLRIDPKRADILIKKFVSLVNSALIRKKYCRLEGIGYLIKMPDKNITLKDTFWKSHKYPSLEPMRVV